MGVPMAKNAPPLSELLELPDPDLARYLIAGDVPRDPRQAALCRAVPNRIELRPALRAAVAASVWISSIDAVIFFALDLPLLARIALCICAATICSTTIHSVFLLGGARASGRCDWSESGQLYAFQGRYPRELSVVLAPGSFRLGRDWLLLWVKCCDGVHAIFIDGARQDPSAFRQLCRRLENGRECVPGQAARPKLIPSIPKV